MAGPSVFQRLLRGMSFGKGEAEAYFPGVKDKPVPDDKKKNKLDPQKLLAGGGSTESQAEPAGGQKKEGFFKRFSNQLMDGGEFSSSGPDGEIIKPGKGKRLGNFARLMLEPEDHKKARYSKSEKPGEFGFSDESQIPKEMGGLPLSGVDYTKQGKLTPKYKMPDGDTIDALRRQRKAKNDADKVKSEEIYGKKEGGGVGKMLASLFAPKEDTAYASQNEQSASGSISVISPDGKKGKIPSSQWEAASKQGYKRAS